MNDKKEKIKLSKWLEAKFPHDLPDKGDLINIIETIAEATIPIRGLLERGITSREIRYRMSLEAPLEDTKNLFDEEQIHEDILTHSIILKAIQDGDTDYAFIASEEAEPVVGKGKFGISIDPVDGSSNVAVNRTVGTIVGIYNLKGKIICSFYVLYGIFTNLILAVNGKVAEFILDTSPYSMSFYHYVFYEEKSMLNEKLGGIRCLGGDPNEWSNQCKAYEQVLIKNHFKDRYSGSLVSDFHAIIKYGGIYAYFLQKGKAKIRLYYEWLPLAFIAKTLGGEFLIIEDQNKIKKMNDIELLTKDSVKKIHATTCGGLIGSKAAVNWYKEIGK